MSWHLVALTVSLFALACAGVPARAADQYNERRLLAAIAAVQNVCPVEFDVALGSGVAAMNVFAFRSGATVGVVPTNAPEGLVGVYTGLVRATPNIDSDALTASGLEAVSGALSDECRAALPEDELSQRAD